MTSSPRRLYATSPFLLEMRIQPRARVRPGAFVDLSGPAVTTGEVVVVGASDVSDGAKGDMNVETRRIDIQKCGQLALRLKLWIVDLSRRYWLCGCLGTTLSCSFVCGLVSSDSLGVLGSTCTITTSKTVVSVQHNVGNLPHIIIDDNLQSKSRSSAQTPYHLQYPCRQSSLAAFVRSMRLQSDSSRWYPNILPPLSLPRMQTRRRPS